jgi:hypothetical protein
MDIEKLDTERIQKLPLKDKKVIAKELYYEYAKATIISRTLDIALPTVKSWIYGAGSKSKGWKIERELAQNQLLKDLSTDKLGMVQSMVGGSIYLLYHFIEKKKVSVIANDQPISIREAEKITNMLQNLHKIVEQDKDDPNNNTNPNYVKPTNPKELLERLDKADPFNTVITSAKEVRSENSDDDDIIVDADIN